MSTRVIDTCGITCALIFYHQTLSGHQIRPDQTLQPSGGMCTYLPTYLYKKRFSSNIFLFDIFLNELTRCEWDKINI